MHTTTQAIILHTVKYSDNSIILHAYTELFGRTSYMINGIKSKKCAIKPALLLPLSIVELEVEHHPKKEIHRIKESKITYSFCSIPFNPIKNSISFFVSEVLFRCLKETEKNDPLFHFLSQSILILDNQDKGIANFHLIFLIRLSSFLGFYPNMDNPASNTYFDLLNGYFLSCKPLHNQFLPIPESDILKELLHNSFETMHTLSYSKEQRNNILGQLIGYYRLHLTEFGQIKSLDVLQTLFS